MTLRLMGDRIRLERKKSHLTMEALSEIAEISTSFLGYLERGERRASLETIERVARALRLDPIDLLSRAGERDDYLAEACRSFGRIIDGMSRDEVKGVLSVVRAFADTRQKGRRRPRAS